jgi:hypothetical protein
MTATRSGPCWHALLASLFHTDRWDCALTLRRQGVAPSVLSMRCSSRRPAERFEGDTMPSELSSSPAGHKRKLGKVPILRPPKATQPPEKPSASKPTPVMQPPARLPVRRPRFIRRSKAEAECAGRDTRAPPPDRGCGRQWPYGPDAGRRRDASPDCQLTGDAGLACQPGRGPGRCLVRRPHQRRLIRSIFARPPGFRC